MDMMENKSLFKAVIAKNSFTLIMSKIYSNSSEQYAHRQGGWYESNFCVQDVRSVTNKFSLDVDSSKMLQLLKRTFLLDAVDEKDAPRLNY